MISQIGAPMDHGVFEDMQGSTIEVGTLIAMPFSQGSMGYVRIGRVTELIPGKDKYQDNKIRVRWLIKESYSPLNSLVSNYRRSLVMPADFPVPDDDD